jgi:hypothetical protein
MKGTFTNSVEITESGGAYNVSVCGKFFASFGTLPVAQIQASMLKLKRGLTSIVYNLNQENTDLVDFTWN